MKLALVESNGKYTVSCSTIFGWFHHIFYRFFVFAYLGSWSHQISFTFLIQAVSTMGWSPQRRHHHPPGGLELSSRRRWCLGAALPGAERTHGTQQSPGGWWVFQDELFLNCPIQIPLVSAIDHFQHHLSDPWKIVAPVQHKSIGFPCLKQQIFLLEPVFLTNLRRRSRPCVLWTLNAASWPYRWTLGSANGGWLLLHVFTTLPSGFSWSSFWEIYGNLKLLVNIYIYIHIKLYN